MQGRCFFARSSSLLLRSKTTLRFYFEKTGAGTCSADTNLCNAITALTRYYEAAKDLFNET